jgi:hypothetical protein
VLVGGVVMGAAVLGLRVGPWAVTAALGARTDLHERATLLARARAEWAALPALRDSAAVLTRAFVGLAPRVVDGPTPVEAGADLAARLHYLAARAPARLDQVDPVPDSVTAGRLARARVQVTLETDIRGLARFLADLEGGDPLLIVERLEVVATDPAAADRRPEVLRVALVVTGWFLTAPRADTRTGNG